MPESGDRECQRVLLIGAGMIGTFAAKSLSESGASVVCIDRKPREGYFHRYGPRADTQLCQGDFLDIESLGGQLSETAPDTLILCASAASRPGGTDSPAAKRANLEATEGVARLCVNFGVSRLVYLSSFAVYGRSRAACLRESAKLRPLTEYGKTKAEAESVLRCCASSKFQIRILRPCGVYGPLPPGDEGSQSARLMQSLLLHAALHGRVTVKAAPAAADEFIYVKDLGLAISLVALGRDDEAFGIVNVGPGKKTTFVELGRALEELFPDLIVERLADAQRFQLPPLDVTKIAAGYGFAPTFSLKAGLADQAKELGLLR